MATKHLKTIALLVALLAVLMSLESKELSLSALQELALQNNLLIRQIRSQVESKALQERIANNANYPQLSVLSTVSYNTDITKMDILNQQKEIGTHDRYDFALQAKQSLWTGNRNRQTIKTAKLESEEANLQLKAMETMISYQCSHLYYQILALHKQVELYDESISRLDNQLARVTNLYREKQAVSLDTLDVSNRKLSLKSQQNECKNNIKQLMLQLQETVNTEEEIFLNKELSAFPEINTLIYYKDKALALRTELLTLDVQDGKIDAQKTIINSGRMPQIYAFGEYHLANPGIQQNEGWNPYGVVGVTFSWNIFDWNTTDYRVQQIKLAQKQLSSERERTAQQIAREIEQVYMNIELSLEQDLILNKLVEQEALRYQLAQKRVENKAMSNLDLLDYESYLNEAKSKYEINKIRIFELYEQLKYYCAMEEK
ncbi:MAG TPA: TolC family protein [Candidatus Cloacimonadota bacterium]|nr:TolC family protein [Candidatus Cloacimonadota bacterium]HOQ79922.1 TolC family protein [Candidatus Cloacimonadota bacterium]